MPVGVGGGEVNPLGHHHDAEFPAHPLPLEDLRAHVLEAEGHLGDQDDIGAPGQPRPHRDPAGVPAHQLHDHHPVVALGRGLQPVQGLRGRLYGGFEAEGDLGGRQVIVDGLRHPHQGHAQAGELMGDLQGAVAPDDHQPVEVQAAEVVQANPGKILHHLAAVLGGLVGERVAPVGGAQDGAAAGQDAADARVVELAGLPGPDQAVESVFNAQHPPAVVDQGRLHHPANHRVQPRAVPAPGANADGADGGRHVAASPSGKLAADGATKTYSTTNSPPGSLARRKQEW